VSEDARDVVSGELVEPVERREIACLNAFDERSE
jgi:hypothetical protein